jgi:hypothetical protein
VINKKLNLIFVSRHILTELFQPLRTILGWSSRISAPDVPVPKTPIHKYGQMMPCQNNVRATWQFLVMQPIAKSLRMQISPYQQFRPGVFALDARHHAGTRFCIDYICHSW